jgi:hypothetical protein
LVVGSYDGVAAPFSFSEFKNTFYDIILLKEGRGILLLLGELSVALLQYEVRLSNVLM